VNKLITWLRTRGLTSTLIFALIILAGPLVADVAVLIDLITVVGADVFLLSIVLYYSSGLVRLYRAWVSIIRMAAIRSGLLMPHERWARSPAEWCRYLGHNLCVLSTVRPVRIASLTFIFLTSGSALLARIAAL
jgi:hypothetical protein